MKGERDRLRRTRAVGVVVPVHNEQELLGSALVALEGSLALLTDSRLVCGVAIVLDSCDDASYHVAEEWRRDMRRRWPVMSILVIECQSRNVGIARALGCAALLKHWTSIDATQIWLATTDADSQVPATWLSTQVRAHEAGADLWTGRVTVNDWNTYDPQTRKRWIMTYEAEEYPIHGTSMGFNALRYLEAGGFPHLSTGEDREMCVLLAECGARSVHDASIRVLTSARRSARAPLGFSHALDMIDMAWESHG